MDEPPVSDVLDGVVALVCCKTESDLAPQAAITAKLRSLGAKVASRPSKEVTHVIFQKRLHMAAQYRQTEEAELRGLYDKLAKFDPPAYVVSPLWLQHTVETGRRAIERRYIVAKPADPVFLAANQSATHAGGSAVKKARRRSVAAPKPKEALPLDFSDAMFSSTQQINEGTDDKAVEADPNGHRRVQKRRHTFGARRSSSAPTSPPTFMPLAQRLQLGASKRSPDLMPPEVAHDLPKSAAGVKLCTASQPGNPHQAGTCAVGLVAARACKNVAWAEDLHATSCEAIDFQTQAAGEQDIVRTTISSKRRAAGAPAAAAPASSNQQTSRRTKSAANTPSASNHVDSEPDLHLGMVDANAAGHPDTVPVAVTSQAVQPPILRSSPRRAPAAKFMPETQQVPQMMPAEANQQKDAGHLPMQSVASPVLQQGIANLVSPGRKLQTGRMLPTFSRGFTAPKLKQATLPTAASNLPACGLLQHDERASCQSASSLAQPQDIVVSHPVTGNKLVDPPSVVAGQQPVQHQALPPLPPSAIRRSTRKTRGTPHPSPLPLSFCQQTGQQIQSSGAAVGTADDSLQRDVVMPVIAAHTNHQGAAKAPIAAAGNQVTATQSADEAFAYHPLGNASHSHELVLGTCVAAAQDGGTRCQAAPSNTLVGRKRGRHSSDMQHDLNPAAAAGMHTIPSTPCENVTIQNHGRSPVVVPASVPDTAPATGIASRRSRRCSKPPPVPATEPDSSRGPNLQPASTCKKPPVAPALRKQTPNATPEHQQTLSASKEGQQTMQSVRRSLRNMPRTRQTPGAANAEAGGKLDKGRASSPSPASRPDGLGDIAAASEPALAADDVDNCHMLASNAVTDLPCRLNARHPLPGTNCMQATITLPADAKAAVNHARPSKRPQTAGPSHIPPKAHSIKVPKLSAAAVAACKPKGAVMIDMDAQGNQQASAPPSTVGHGRQSTAEATAIVRQLQKCNQRAADDSLLACQKGKVAAAAVVKQSNRPAARSAAAKPLPSRRRSTAMTPRATALVASAKKRINNTTKQSTLTPFLRVASTQQTAQSGGKRKAAATGTPVNLVEPATSKKQRLQKSEAVDSINKQQAPGSQHRYGKDHPMRAGILYLAATSVDSAITAILMAAVKQIPGARLCADGYESGHVTHLIIGSDRRTIKALIAIASGSVMVTPAWLTASVAAGKWLPVDEYISPVKYAAVATSVRELLQHQSPLAKPLRDKLVYIHYVPVPGQETNKVAANKDGIEKLVGVLGGRVVPPTSCNICILINNIRKPSRVPAGVPCVRVEWLLTLAETHVVPDMKQYVATWQ